MHLKSLAGFFCASGEAPVYQCLKTCSLILLLNSLVLYNIDLGFLYSHCIIILQLVVHGFVCVCVCKGMLCSSG